MSDFFFVTLGFAIGVGFCITVFVLYAHLMANSSIDKDAGRQTMNNEESPRG